MSASSSAGGAGEARAAVAGAVSGQALESAEALDSAKALRSAGGAHSAGGLLSADAKEALTLEALGLLNEQVQARIVHYRSDLATSPELDAITAHVVAQIHQMQAAAQLSEVPQRSSEEIEAEQIATLGRLLVRVTRGGDKASVVHQNLKAIGKRVAKRFFESELHEKTKADKEKRIYHAEQGVYYVLGRYRHRLRTELEGFDYVDAAARQQTLELLAKLERDLQVGFLSRRSPELNRVMAIFTTVLVDFFQQHLPPRVEQLARVVIRGAGTAREPGSLGYKIGPQGFQGFRVHWERHLMQQMVHYCGDHLLEKLAEGQQSLREETLLFFTDPHIYSETCEVACDALYDYLCLEGFLDLPVDWRVKLSRESG